MCCTDQITKHRQKQTHKQVATYPRRVDFAVEITVRAFEPTLVMADLPIAVALLTAALLTTAVLVLLAISVAEAATDPPACPTFRIAISQMWVDKRVSE